MIQIETLTLTDQDVDTLVRQYAITALWSSLDYTGVDDSGDGEPIPMDEEHDITDLTDDAWRSFREDVTAFVESNAADVAAWVRAFDGDVEQVGHDLWLTRNGHGAGFWDRFYGDEPRDVVSGESLSVIGERLSKAAHVWGEVELYVGDDGMIDAQ